MLQLNVLSFPSSNFTFVTSLDTAFSLYNVLFTEQLSTSFLVWQVYVPTSFSETSFSISVLEENRVIELQAQAAVGLGSKGLLFVHCNGLHVSGHAAVS